MQNKLNLLVNYVQAGKRTQAAQLLADILTINPPLGVSWLGVAKLAMLSANYGLSKQCLEKSIINDKDIKSWLMKWGIETQLRPISELISDIELNHQVKINQSPEIQHLLGTLHSQIGNINKAKNYFEQVVSTRKTSGETWLSYATLCQKYDSLDLLDKMNKVSPLFSNQQLSATSRSAFYNGLARLYDNQNNYEKAYEFYSKSNQLLQSKFVFNEKQNEVIRANLNKIQIKSDSAKSFTPPVSNKNIVFIIGLPRSGTTLLESLIASNDNAFNFGEINALDIIVNEYTGNAGWGLDTDNVHSILNIKNISSIRNKYLTILNEKSNDSEARIYTDKSLSNNRMLPIIKLAFPEAKIVYIKRNNQNVIWSCFKAHFSQGLAWSNNLESIKHFIYKEEELTEKLIATFCEPNNLYKIQYETLVQDKNRILAELAQFLNFSYSSDWNIKSDIEVKTSSTIQVREKLHSKSIDAVEPYRKFINL